MIYEKYMELRTEAHKCYDWYDLAMYVASELEQDTNERRYKHIIIDEGQDFSPMMIKSLVKAIPSDGSFTFSEMWHNKFMEIECLGKSQN